MIPFSLNAQEPLGCLTKVKETLKMTLCPGRAVIISTPKVTF